MHGNNTGMAEEVWRGVRGLDMAAAAAAADFSSVTKLLRHGPNKSAGEKWYTGDDRCLRKKQWLNQNTDNLCLSASPDTPVAIITLPLSPVLSLCLSLIHLLRSLHSHYILSWLLWTDSVDDFCCQAGLNGHRHTRAASLFPTLSPLMQPSSSLWFTPFLLSYLPSPPTSSSLQICLV